MVLKTSVLRRPINDDELTGALPSSGLPFLTHAVFRYQLVDEFIILFFFLNKIIN